MSRGAAAPPCVAWFVSPHGFGHAARACAIMQALFARDAAARAAIFTQTPEWFFRESLPAGRFDYIDVKTDIGLAQRTAFEEDLAESLRVLDGFYPLPEALIERLAGEVRRRGAGLVVCDVAPMGVAVARAAGVPSILTENFTWDWIYEEYLGDAPGFAPHIAYLRGLFDAADARIQTEPVCARRECALTTPPVSRHPRQSREETRRALGVGPGERLVLVSMGGVEERYDRLSDAGLDGATLLVIGGVERPERRGPILRLPHRSGYYHPDLIGASDAIIGKLGYSTLAEAAVAGVPYGYIPRARFRESPPLAAYVAQRMAGLEISEAEYQSGAWSARVGELLALERRPPLPNGAAPAAEFILRRVRQSPPGDR